MKIVYHNGWSKERIQEWLKVHMEMRRLSVRGINGYQIDFEDGSRYEVIVGDYIQRLPTEVYISGELVQQAWG